MPTIIPAGELEQYFPGYAGDTHAALWRSAEDRVKAILGYDPTLILGHISYQDTILCKVYAPRRPINTTPTIEETGTTLTALTVDTAIGADDKDFVPVDTAAPAKDRIAVQMHGEYHNSGHALKVTWPSLGYDEPDMPYDIKKAVGLAMGILRGQDSLGATQQQSVGGESYQAAADPWTGVRTLLARYIAYAV